MSPPSARFFKTPAHTQKRGDLLYRPMILEVTEVTHGYTTLDLGKHTIPFRFVGVTPQVTTPVFRATGFKIKLGGFFAPSTIHLTTTVSDRVTSVLPLAG